MSKDKYVVQCPLCGWYGEGITDEDCEAELKYHAWEKHPVEYSHTQGYNKEDKGSE